MKDYNLIVIGTGSVMGIVELMVERNPAIKIAVIDKDEPGGICLTRGCYPSKLLLYPAELVRSIEKGKELGVSAKVTVDFEKIMKRMRTIIDTNINAIRLAFTSSTNLDYYPSAAEFVSPYTIKVSGETIKSPMIFLCIGSRATIPEIKGLDSVRYHTSDTVLHMTSLPKRIIIIGAGYIGAEYAHFFSSMGAEVTIIGRNAQFLPEEEPEIAGVARRELEGHMKIITSNEVIEIKERDGVKEVTAREMGTGKESKFEAEEVMLAAGREPISDILHPERGGIETDAKGWITVDDYLETSQPNVWALGDADGTFLFKHVANYESEIVYANAILKKRTKAKYNAIPHAVFTYPEVAGVGLGEKAAIKAHGKDGILIGFYRYRDTIKGEAMGSKEYFAKVIVESETLRLLGAHIVGPYASILIQEIVNIMYTPEQSAQTIIDSIHIHPALTEVVDGAVGSLMPPEHYHHVLAESGISYQSVSRGE